MTVEITNNLLEITMGAPETFQNQTVGLAGVMNGDTSDDLTTPDGTVIPTSSSERTIYYDFGEKC